MFWQEINIYLFLLFFNHFPLANMSTVESGPNCELYWDMVPFIESVCEEAVTDTAFHPYNFGSAKYIQVLRSAPRKFSAKSNELRVPVII